MDPGEDSISGCDKELLVTQEIVEISFSDEQVAGNPREGMK